MPALALLLATGGPMLLHLCTMTAPAAAGAHGVHGESALPPCHEEAPGPPEAPEAQACCLTVAAIPAAPAVVAAPAEGLAPAVTLRGPSVAEAAVLVPAPEVRDTGPPPLPVRSHLALSVLLL
ncbi:MAG: hypothetical protein R3362_11660 [Rhodothermales bacterium]|nr:hypothetical protein [Rhodothermales bacterium]